MWAVPVRTDKTDAAPVPLMFWHRIEIDVRPSRVSFCKSGFGTGYLKTRALDLHFDMK